VPVARSSSSATSRPPRPTAAPTSASASATPPVGATILRHHLAARQRREGQARQQLSGRSGRKDFDAATCTHMPQGAGWRVVYSTPPCGPVTSKAAAFQTSSTTSRQR
jgi:hypothetical protein